MDKAAALDTIARFRQAIESRGINISKLILYGNILSWVKSFIDKRFSTLPKDVQVESSSTIFLILNNSKIRKIKS